MKDLTDLLNNLAANLGIAVDMLWTALMRQALIEGISDLIFIALLVIAIYWVNRWLKWIMQPHRDEIAWVPFVLVSLPIIVMTIAVMFNIGMIFAEFFNPQYWALHKILSTISGK